MKFSALVLAALCGVVSAGPFVARQNAATPEQIAALAVDLGAFPNTNPNCTPTDALSSSSAYLRPSFSLQLVVIAMAQHNQVEIFQRFRALARLLRMRTSR